MQIGGVNCAIAYRLNCHQGLAIRGCRIGVLPSSPQRMHPKAPQGGTSRCPG